MNFYEFDNFSRNPSVTEQETVAFSRVLSVFQNKTCVFMHFLDSLCLYSWVWSNSQKCNIKDRILHSTLDYHCWSRTSKRLHIWNNFQFQVQRQEETLEAHQVEVVRSANEDVSSCIPYVQRWTNVSSNNNLLSKNKSELLAKIMKRRNNFKVLYRRLLAIFFSWRAIICQQKQIFLFSSFVWHWICFFSRSSHQINERSRSGEGFFDDDGSLKVKTQEKKNWGNFYKTKLEVWKGSVFLKGGGGWYFFNFFFQCIFSILSRNRVVEVVVVFNSFLLKLFIHLKICFFFGVFDVMIMMIRSVTG